VERMQDVMLPSGALAPLQLELGRQVTTGYIVLCAQTCAIKSRHLLHEGLAGGGKVAEAVPVVQDAVEAVQLQGVHHGAEGRVHLAHGPLEVLHGHLPSHDRRRRTLNNRLVHNLHNS
jgi:hypothetical protein